MLNNYINDYIDAYLKQDKRKMSQIERSLSRVGMDKQTLLYLVKSELKEIKIVEETE